MRSYTQQTRAILGALCVILLTPPPPAAARQWAGPTEQYHILEIGSGVVPTDINNRQEVVGYDTTTQEGFVWSVTARRSLGRIEADGGLHINDTGTVVGIRQMGGRRQPLAWFASTSVLLPTPPADEIRRILDFTNNGIVLMRGEHGSWASSTAHSTI